MKKMVGWSSADKKIEPFRLYFSDKKIAHRSRNPRSDWKSEEELSCCNHFARLYSDFANCQGIFLKIQAKIGITPISGGR
jgi:hypothetical protein